MPSHELHRQNAPPFSAAGRRPLCDLLAPPVLLALLLAPQIARAQTGSDWVQTHLPSFFSQQVVGVAVWQILGVALLAFISVLMQRLALFVISSWVRRLVGRVLPKLEKVVERSARPLSGLVTALVFWLGFPALGFGRLVTQVVMVAVKVLGVASGVWLFYRQTDVLSEYLAEKASKTTTKLDDQLVPLLRRTLKLFVVLIGGIFVLQNLDVDVASLVAGLGLGGLAFALAAKDTVANFFGAITIFVDRPFQIGDWIIIDKVEGTVEDVGFRTTRVRTFYNSLVTIPNSKLTGSPIDNMGARVYRRIKAILSLTYSTTPDQMQAFVEGLRAIIQAHPDTRKDYYEIHFHSYGSSSLDVLVYFFVKVPSWSAELRARHEIFLSILRLAGEVGVEFAFPTRTLHVDSFPEKEPRAAGVEHCREDLAAAIAGFGPGGRLSRPRGKPLTHGYLAGFTPEVDPQRDGSIAGPESEK